MAVYVLGAIGMIAILFDKSPWVLLSGIGAMTAVLLLIFKDTILSLVASLQIGTYDLVRIGDWIKMPQYGADGDVIDISLHTVKVQNFDKTSYSTARSPRTRLRGGIRGSFAAPGTSAACGSWINMNGVG
jgi:small-conductance mechanosensitive channel